jgi:tripartite-type tricarboxylate transporter receptor subunit TctC
MVGREAATEARGWPERNLRGIIQWGAGGATDTMSRAITPHVEPLLGRDVILLNRSGGAGAISTRFVHAQQPDGYHLLYGAEDPQLHGVLGSEIDYDAFHTVSLLARGISVIVANPDRPWTTLDGLIADIEARPGEIRMGSTGPGGLPFVVGAMLGTVSDFEVVPVPFDGDGPAINALLGGHVDFLPAGVTATAEHVRAGRLRALAVVNHEPVDLLPGVPPISDAFPDLERYLPWGPFYGVFVHADAPPDVRARLTEAYQEAARTPAFQQFVQDFGAVPMNIAGAEADAFLDHWQSVTTWLLHDAGATRRSPEEFGIPRP